MTQILIIDDDPIMRMILKKTLQEQGYQVSVAQSGEDGILQAQQVRPALIICDWLMSGMDGLEVCRQIKSDASLANTFFILLTSRTAVADRVEGLDTGADEFLAKPIDVNELEARVRAGLRLHQANQALQQMAQDLQQQKHLLEAELAEAADYVKTLLPAPIEGSVAIDARFLPSRQLGGDCFDYYWLDPDYLVVYLLDVSGHGLGAALPSVAIQNFLRSQTVSSVNFYQPSAVLTALNEAFQTDEQHQRYFTIWYGVYNVKKRQLSYASAGHPPAILLTGTANATPSIQHLKTRGKPIGLFPEAKFVNECCTVEASSTLYIFSDGLYEIKLKEGNIYGIERFVNLLMQHRQVAQCELDQIIDEVKALSHSSILEDDCSILQIQFS